MTQRRQYAEDTEVPILTTRMELERLLQQHGATETGVINSTGRAAVVFQMHERRIMFTIDLPAPKSREFTHVKRGRYGSEVPVSSTDAARRHEQACRRRWRALLLSVKAKLVAVADGIAAFEDEFLAHIVMPDGSRVADHVRPRIAEAYEQRRMLPLLPGPPDERQEPYRPGR